MIDTLQSEWIKLSTLMVNKVLIAIAVAFPIVVCVLVGALSDDFITTSDAVDLIAGLTLLSSLLFGVVAAINMSGEFNYNTIRPTFAAQPLRLLALLGKLIVLLVVTALLMVGIIAVCWLLLSALAEGSFELAEQPGLGSPTTALTGSALVALGVALAGFGLGNMIRNTPATVTLLLLWPLLIENILGRLLFAALDLEWDKYLPFTEGLTLGFLDRDGGDDLMSRLGAGLFFFAVVIGLTLVGLARTQRADA